MAKKKNSNPKKPAAGRPKGTKNVEHPQVDGELTACPQCKSTARGPYKTKDVVKQGGERNGKTYTEVWFRVCQCSDCGQSRVDRHYVNNPTE